MVQRLGLINFGIKNSNNFHYQYGTIQTAKYKQKTYKAEVKTTQEAAVYNTHKCFNT